MRLETLLQMNDVVNLKTDTGDEEETGKALLERFPSVSNPSLR
jgi:hypothetical protein